MARRPPNHWERYLKVSPVINGNARILTKVFRFHAIYFPAFLIAVGLPLPQSLLSHAHWVRDGRKMSKSLGNVVDPIAAIKTEGIDVVRWYLARVGGRFKDDVSEYTVRPDTD